MPFMAAFVDIFWAINGDSKVWIRLQGLLGEVVANEEHKLVATVIGWDR